MDKNFGLSYDDFERLVNDLKRNETSFFKTVFLKHFRECVLFLQKQNSASFDDAHDAAMDTIIQFRKLLVEGKLKYGNLRYFFTRMASRTYFRNKKERRKQEMIAENMEQAEFDPDSREDENIALLNAAWAELGPDCRELLKLHYYGQMRLIEIADYKEKTPAAIRKQKERCIKKLRNIFQKEKLTR